MTHVSATLNRFRLRGFTALDEVLIASELDAAEAREIREGWVWPEILEATVMEDV